jgi:hypothetical protein
MSTESSAPAKPRTMQQTTVNQRKRSCKRATRSVASEASDWVDAYASGVVGASSRVPPQSSSAR